ncbi:MAG: RsmD family RNA methyltransferase [Isosphaeraceae bacterium]
MRIIAGQRRGHKISGPRASADTRPTSDLVRESLFNILGDLVPDRLVVDLFAGTGAVGLEALSRGASRAIFVERDRENVGLIHRNIATLRYEGRAQVRHADAYRWARSLRPLDDRPIVVFLDPPYRDYEVNARRLWHTIGGLFERLPAGSAVALESGRILDGQILPDFDSWDVRRYGNSQVAIRVSPGTQAPEAARADQAAPERAGGDEPAAGGVAAAEPWGEAEESPDAWDDNDDST